MPFIEHKHEPLNPLKTNAKTIKIIILFNVPHKRKKDMLTQEATKFLKCINTTYIEH